MQTTVAIEDLVNWSEPKAVRTKLGPRQLRTAKPTDEFWSAWRSDKQSLKDAGISCSKNRQTGAWEVCWWLPDEEKQNQIDEAVKFSKATDSNVDIPSPEGLEYLPYQRAGIAYSLSRENVLIGDEMGLGKTIQAIGIANATKARRCWSSAQHPLGSTGKRSLTSGRLKV